MEIDGLNILLDTGHFALEEDADVIADLMREFLQAIDCEAAAPEIWGSFLDPLRGAVGLIIQS